MHKYYSISSVRTVHRLFRHYLFCFGVVLITTLLLATAHLAVAQSVNLITGGSAGNSFGQATATAPDGNVYVAGAFSGTVTISGTQVISAGSYDIFLAKYNTAGVLQWLRRAGGSANDGGIKLAVDASGVYVTGGFSGTATFDTPSSPASNTLTSKGNSDIFVAKYDASGTLQWLLGGGGSSRDSGSDIKVDASGVYVTGGFSGTATFDAPSSPASNTLTSSGDEDIFVARYDASGILQWLRRGGGSDNTPDYSDAGNALAVYAGAVYVTGYFSGTADFSTPSGPASNTLVSAGSKDIFVAKYDADGVLQWLRRAGGTTGGDAGGGIGVNASGVYVTGNFFGTIDFNTPSDPTNNTLTVGSNNINVFVAKYDTDGVVQWLRRAGPTDEYSGSSLAVDANGVYVTGNFFGTANFNTPSSTASNTLVAAGNLDVFVAKYDDNGVVQWLRRAGGTTYSTSYGLAVDANGVYVTGYVQSTANFNTPSAFGSNELIVPVSGTTTYFLARFTHASPTLTDFAASPTTVCAGGVTTFTATVGNVTGAYDFTLTNGSSTTTGTVSSTPFSQTWTATGSGTQSFTLTIAANGASATASTSLKVSAPSPDYQPLVDLYNATNGAGWTTKTGWLSGCDPCTGNGGNPWSGITCSSGRVTILSLPTNGLNGTLPASLSALTNLQYLFLNNNQLSGSIPASLNALTDLAYMDLSANQLSASIPVSLSALTNLQLLSLNNNQLSGSIPASLSALTNLKQLYLNNNQLSGSIPPSLSALTSLQLLILNNNQLTGSIPSSLSALATLQQILLYNNQLTGGIPSSLSGLTNLQALSLNNNQLTGSIPASLSALTNLQYLILNNNQLTGNLPTGLSALTNLQSLFLNSNQLSGCIPAEFSVFCSKNVKLYSNPGLPGGGDFAAFCSNGTGSSANAITGINGLPAGQSVCVGGSVRIPVSVSGTADSYQWYKDGAPLSGQTSATLTLSNVQLSDGGSYAVAASGCNSLTSSAFSLTVNALPTVSITPSPSSTITSGGSVTLTAATASSFLWSDGSTTNPLVLTNVTSSTVVSVTGTTNGCSATASVGISVTLNITAPDLTPLFSLPDANFPNTPGASKNLVVKIQEVGGLPTAAGNITVVLTAPEGYTLAFDNTLRSIEVSGGLSNPVSVNNGDWEAGSVVKGEPLSLSIKAGTLIEAYGASVIGLRLVRTTANSGSVANITVNVVDDTGGGYDHNAANNIYVRILNGL